MKGTPHPSAFVTYGWCRSAYTVVRSLAARGVEVHVGDSSPFAMSRFSRFTKSFTRLPDFFAEPEAHVDSLGEAIERAGCKALMPCFEDDELVIRHRDRLPADIRGSVPMFVRAGGVAGGGGILIQVFRPPFWLETRVVVTARGESRPQDRSTGWDIGITPENPGLIKGNYDWCKLSWQLLVGRGLKPLLERCG